MDAEERRIIKDIVMETIRELKKNGFLKDIREVAYRDINMILKSYYENGEQDGQIKKVLDLFAEDEYFKIIPLYFGYGYTIEEIAETLDKDVSTINRNKKRLCLDIYDLIDPE